MSANIMKYINAPNKKKIWTLLSPEFGRDKDQNAIVVWVLYGFKSGGVAFQSHLADYLRHHEYKSK